MPFRKGSRVAEKACAKSPLLTKSHRTNLTGRSPVFNALRVHSVMLRRSPERGGSKPARGSDSRLKPEAESRSRSVSLTTAQPQERKHSEDGSAEQSQRSESGQDARSNQQAIFFHQPKRDDEG